MVDSLYWHVARTSLIRTLTSSQLFGLTGRFEHAIHAPSRAGGPMTSDLSCPSESYLKMTLGTASTL